MKSCRLLGALVLAVLSAAAGASPAFAGKRPIFQTPPDAPVARLVSPAAGEVWTAGSPVAVEWEPGPGLGMLPHAEEWEAFLSVDGGGTYPLRITPHLDRSVRRFVVQVPRLPTGQARLLLRFGDERREVESEMPAVFTIVDGPVSASLPPRLALGRGEPARERDDPDGGVVAWVEGPRDGGRSYQVEAGGRPLAYRGVAAGHPFPLFLAGPAAGPVLLHPPAREEGEDLTRRTAVARPLQESPLPASRVAVRLLIHRFNE